MADTKLSENPKTVEYAIDNVVIMKKVLESLQLFLPITLAKITIHASKSRHGKAAGILRQRAKAADG